MKKNKYFFVLCMLLAISLAGGIFIKVYGKLEDGGGEGSLRVVTSFYPVYIAALNVVGDSQGVELENLSEPQTGCLHDYQLTPQDMILLSKADLFLVNGGGIEGFLAEVGESYPELMIAEAADGIELLEEQEGGHGHSHVAAEAADGIGLLEEQEGSHGHSGAVTEAAGGDGLLEEQENSHGQGNREGLDENDPMRGTDSSGDDRNAHGWMDTQIYAKMVENIADDISKLDPENAEVYQENAREYCAEIQGLSEQISEIRDLLAKNKPRSFNVVILHEAYAYVAEQYGLHTAYCLNLDEERQVSAREVAEVMEEIEENQVDVVFAEELYGKDMGNAIEKETDCSVCYLDPLVRGETQADSYLAMMQKNIDIIKQAFLDGSE